MKFGPPHGVYPWLPPITKKWVNAQKIEITNFIFMVKRIFFRYEVCIHRKILYLTTSYIRDK